MKFSVLVNGGVYDSQAGHSAWQFCRTALQAGHQISQVFFYQQAVDQASCLNTPLADEFDVTQAWVDLQQQHSLDLVVCVSAAERRGVLSQSQIEEHTDDALKANLHPAFRVAGLGVLHEASLQAERMVSFQ